MDLDIDEAAAVGRGERGIPDAAARLPMLALPGRQDDPIVPVGGQADDLEPAVGIRGEEERSIRQPASTDIDTLLARHDPRHPARDLDDRDLRGFDDLRAARPHDRDPAAIGRPFEGFDIDARLRQDGRSRRLRLGRRAAATRHGRIDQPDLRPAATTGQEGQPMAIGRPARLAPGAGLADHAGQPRSVRLDDPDLFVADEREPAPVGRPLGVGHGLVRGRQLRRIAAAQGHREELARPGGLGGVGHDPVPRMEPELAGHVDRDDRLDRQVGRGGRGRGRHQGRPPARPPVTHHGPSIARCLRACPWRQS